MEKEALSKQVLKIIERTIKETGNYHDVIVIVEEAEDEEEIKTKLDRLVRETKK